MKFNEWLKKKDLKGKIANAASVLMKLTGGGKFHEVIAPNTTQTESEAMWSDAKFLAWLASQGVPWVKGKVPKHSDGGVGRAYFLGDKVVKFTNNRVEGNVANLVSKNPNTPTRIIGVYRVPAKTMWAILQDKVDMNIPEKIKKASDLLMAYVTDVDAEEFPESEAERKQLATSIVQNFAKYGASNEDIPFIVEMMDVMDKLYRQTGFFHDDAVPQNLGMYNNKVVIPDLGPNQPKGFSARKSLDKIHQRRQQLGLPPFDEI